MRSRSRSSRAGVRAAVLRLRGPGYRGDVRPLISLTAMADRYLLELRELQPHGPYFLGGLCQGGLVAYEMARRLRASGEEVRALVLVNPPSQVSLVDPGWGLDELLSFRLASLSAQFGLLNPWTRRDAARIRPLYWYGRPVARRSSPGSKSCGRRACSRRSTSRSCRTTGR
ncbi:alpha/beta fold hydrolase [Streptomyces sp. LBUM 1476]|nr:alpha/beta fold hydrolase [Streptomyces sp. LBUM 1476]